MPEIRSCTTNSNYHGTKVETFINTLIRNPKRSAKDIRAVSEVIGTILMLAVSTAIISAVALWTTSLVDDVEESPHVNFEAALDGKILILTHEGGDDLESEDVIVRVSVEDTGGTEQGFYIFELPSGRQGSTCRARYS